MTTPLAPPKRRRRYVILAVAAAVLVALVATGTAFVYAARPSGPQAAVPACHERVKAQLPTPATAQFATPIVDQLHGEYMISGDFDAQNTFGALMHHTYWCVLVPAGDGSYDIGDVRVY